MSQTPFEDLVDGLAPGALDLFREMVAVHLENTGDGMFILHDTAAGTDLDYFANGFKRQFSRVDIGALSDLTGRRFLHIDDAGRSTNYRVSGEGLSFHRRLMQSEGSAVDQTEAQIRRLTSGPEYAKAHPGVAHHLREAFDLLWSGQTTVQAVSEVGDHLRKALMDATTDLVGPDAEGGQERPIERLKRHLKGLDLPSREAEVVSRIVELAQAVLRLDQRLVHIRDEADKGKPGASWEEIRRAAFTTVFACYELDQIQVAKR